MALRNADFGRLLMYKHFNELLALAFAVEIGKTFQTTPSAVRCVDSLSQRAQLAVRLTAVYA